MQFSAKFTVNADDTISDPEYEKLSKEEKVWHRLKHGVKEMSMSDAVSHVLALELQKEIDKEILNDLVKLTKISKQDEDE